MNLDYIISQQEAFEAFQKKKDLEGLGIKAEDLCGASALFTGLNFLFQSPSYTPESVVKFYVEGLQLHGKKYFLPPEWKKRLPKGWLFFTPDKKIYHHALLWGAKKEGVAGENIEGKLRLQDCEEFLREGGIMLLSLPNKIIEYRTGEKTDLKPGTHLLLWWKIERDIAFLIDPYWKRPESKESLIFAIEINSLQKLWEETFHPKALAFSLFPSKFSLLPPHQSPKLFIPPI